MKIVIELPDDDVKFLMESDFIPIRYFNEIHTALRNGKLLPIANETSQKETSDIERMRGELNEFCRSFVVCKQNGKQCMFYPYCSTHCEFEDKDIKRLYDRMKRNWRGVK